MDFIIGLIIALIALGLVLFPMLYASYMEDSDLILYDEQGREIDHNHHYQG